MLPATVKNKIEQIWLDVIAGGVSQPTEVIRKIGELRKGRVFMISYVDLINSFRNHPRDIVTRPITNRDGKWFYVYTEKEHVVVTIAKENEPKCSISKPRILTENECENMFNLYMMRKQGKKISKVATQASLNQVYWYGIFSDLGL